MKLRITRVPVLSYTLVIAATSAASACSGAGDSVISPPADSGSGDDGGSGASNDDTAASGSNADDGPSGSGDDSGAAGDDSGTPAEAGASCPTPASVTQGSLITLPVSWAATASGASGSGTVHIWLLANLTNSENSLVGTTRICGVTLPPDPLTGAGQLVTGGTKVLITLPDAIWNAKSMPTFPVKATAKGGWNVGATIDYAPVLALLGLKLSDPMQTWPASTWDFPSDTMFPDSDGDGKPGITAVPLGTGGYTLPPTGLGLLGSAPQTDKVYFAQRSEFSLSGKFKSCGEITGTAKVTYFDNRVLGCHINKGSDCTTGAPMTQGDFVDGASTLYVPGSGATFDAKALSAGAACSDVLAAFPAK